MVSIPFFKISLPKAKQKVHIYNMACTFTLKKKSELGFMFGGKINHQTLE
jgi:hypothetical protein